MISQAQIQSLNSCLLQFLLLESPFN